MGGDLCLGVSNTGEEEGMVLGGEKKAGRRASERALTIKRCLTVKEYTGREQTLSTTSAKELTQKR